MGQDLVQSSGYIGDCHRFLNIRQPVLSYDLAGAPFPMASGGAPDIVVMRLLDAATLSLGGAWAGAFGFLGNVNFIDVDVLNNPTFFVGDTEYIVLGGTLSVDGHAIQGYELFRFSMWDRSNFNPDGPFRTHKLDSDGTAMANLIKIQHDFAGGPALLAMAVAAGNNPAIGIKKNAAFGPWPIVLRQSADPKLPATGMTVAAQRSIDGAAFANCANAVTEVGSGVYKHTLAAADTNGTKSVIVKYTATGAVTEFLTLLLTP